MITRDYGRWLSWLSVPDIRIYGCREGLWDLSEAIFCGRNMGFQRIEVIFDKCIKVGLPAFTFKFGRAFTVPGCQNPTFCYETGKRIRMVIKRIGS